jgi:2'-5' RNA ligase
MHYTLGFYPRLEEELAASIDAIRRVHDPTWGYVKPHVTVLFPVPDSVGESRLSDHIESVLKDRGPLDIRFGGLHKSRDHWLFLTLAEGEARVKELHKSLYTGILAKYRKADVEFVPHLGLGLFIKEGSRYDWDNPREDYLDRRRYREALAQAEALPPHSGLRVERLNLSGIPDEVIEWATGTRAEIPEHMRSLEVREFVLSG